MPLKIGSNSYTSGQYKQIKEGEGIKVLSEDEEKILTQWVNQDVEFENTQEFKAELKALKDNWNKQKLFYEGKFDEWKNAPTLAIPTLCSARPLLDAIALYWWAKAKNIPVATAGKRAQGLIERSDRPATVSDAPFTGHCGDRAHTLKHWRQKESGGKIVCLVLIELNVKGAAALKNAATIALGGEGKLKGQFGLKHESHSVSVALGQSKDTWAFLESRIAKITFEA